MATSGTPIYRVITPEGKCKYENRTCDPDVSKRNSLFFNFHTDHYYISPSSCRSHPEIETLYSERGHSGEGESGSGVSRRTLQKVGGGIEGKLYYFLISFVLSYTQEAGIVNNLTDVKLKGVKRDEHKIEKERYFSELIKGFYKVM